MIFRSFTTLHPATLAARRAPPNTAIDPHTNSTQSTDRKSGIDSARITAGSLAAIRWSTIDVGGRQVLQFATMLVLARLVSPAEFGLVGMLSLFIALGTAFVEGGFGSALVQRTNITELDKSSVFHFNTTMGALTALILFSAAPWIARFYEEPMLLALTRVMAVNLLIGSFGAIQSALFVRNLDFRRPCTAGLSAMVISGTTAAWMAGRGYGVWSLAAQTIINTTVSTGLLWVLSPWKPTLNVSATSLRRLFAFGSRLLATGLLNAVFDRVQYTFIGKSFSAKELGFFTRAFSTQQFPVSFLTAIISQVTLPLFSRLANDRGALSRSVRRTQVSVMIPTLPMMVGLALVARPLVLVLYGEKWLPCATALQILSLVGIFRPLYIVNLNLFMALGRSDLALRLELARKGLTVLGLLLTFSVSVTAMVWAMLAVATICFVITCHYSYLLIGYGLLNQLADLAPYIGVSVAMSAVTICVITQSVGQPVLQLTSAVFTSAAFYAIACHVLRLTSYKSLLASAFDMWFHPNRQRSAASGPACTP